MSAITTHVLDTALGRPAAGVRVRLERLAGPTSQTDPETTGHPTQVLAESTTDADGRVRELGPDRAEPGTYRLVFDVAAYAAATGQACFFPEVSLTFALTDPSTHHHVPLLLSPFAYSTYRGS
ncbi:hydroxyisourate hydrolase [Nocardioides panaciterrulae]|uniref:5-hydroxyisourate hydrolase n=1 Tax=Nocardioides panaciterrulae TaxID=661492 RepID=A0A7Y9E3I4_9ACTN|nr:hydroxyisourate hydrolase [Nocardioides panaciterrulae]NYD40563.1 5-hydroxyisourate hydrolase [Nocardioides panaciterrulae]